MAILYKVQSGAYKHALNATIAAASVRRAIKKAKLDISVAVIQSGGWYKVQEGAFSSKANAEKRKDLLRKAGIYTVVVETKTQDAPAPAPTASGWQKVLSVLNSIISAKNPHQAVIDILKRHGYTLKPDSAWCSETVVAAFLDAGMVDLIGGYTTNAPSLKKHAKALGIWHSGDDGIKAGDIVLYGSGEPSHTEIAIDSVYNISGNYEGTAKKRKRAGRAINGYIRPKYPEEKKAEPDTADPRIRVWPIWFFQKNESIYGDCTAILEYAADDKTVAHCILIDCAMGHASSVVISKLKSAGVKKIDAVVISHGHGDHYGGLSDIAKAIPVKAIYVPDTAGLDRYQKSYADAIRRQAKKADESHTLKVGGGFQIGHIQCRVLWQCPASALSEHDSHHFVNNQSVVLRFTLDGTWTLHTAGDLQNEGNNLLVKAVKDLKTDIFKVQWHGDANACNEAICTAVRPLVAFSNYHHAERSGRGTTRKRLEAVGAVVARNHENGDIYIDCKGNTMTLSCSKGNLSKKWVKKTVSRVRPYKVMLTTKATPVSGSGLLAIEPEDYTDPEVQALKKAGYTVLAYMSVGSVSDERPYYKQLQPYTLRRLDEWEHERYLDLCQPKVVDWMIQRGTELLKLYDGLWIDNLDVYEEYPSDKAFDGITKILQTLDPSGYIMINGGIEYVTKAIKKQIKVADGITQEEVFSLITDYSGKGTFGKQTTSQSAAYQKYIATAISAGMEAYLLEYTRDSALKTKIAEYCKASGAGYYISEDVDL